MLKLSALITPEMVQQVLYDVYDPELGINIVDLGLIYEIEEIGEGTHERLHGMIDALPVRIAPWIVAGEVAGR